MQWTITKDGMDFVPNGYWIAADRYNEIATHVGDWCSDWLLHMTGKHWCDYEEFVGSFRQAMVVAGVDPKFDWDRSVAYGRKTRKQHDEWSACYNRLFPPTGEVVAMPFDELDRRCEAVDAALKKR